MSDPKKVGEVLKALFERYHTEELTDLSRMSGVPRQTLVNWQTKPDAAVRSQARKYFHSATEQHTTPEELSEKLDRVAGLLEALLRLEHEGRLHQTVANKRRIHSGGSA